MVDPRESKSALTPPHLKKVSKENIRKEAKIIKSVKLDKQDFQGRSQTSEQDEASFKHRRREPLGGSGGMPTQQSLQSLEARKCSFKHFHGILPIFSGDYFLNYMFLNWERPKSRRGKCLVLPHASCGPDNSAKTAYVTSAKELTDQNDVPNTFYESRAVFFFQQSIKLF